MLYYQFLYNGEVKIVSFTPLGLNAAQELKNRRILMLIWIMFSALGMKEHGINYTISLCIKKAKLLKVPHFSSSCSCWTFEIYLCNKAYVLQDQLV